MLWRVWGGLGGCRQGSVLEGGQVIVSQAEKGQARILAQGLEKPPASLFRKMAGLQSGGQGSGDAHAGWGDGDPESGLPHHPPTTHTQYTHRRTRSWQAGCCRVLKMTVDTMSPRSLELRSRCVSLLFPCRTMASSRSTCGGPTQRHLSVESNRWAQSPSLYQGLGPRSCPWCLLAHRKKVLTGSVMLLVHSYVPTQLIPASSSGDPRRGTEP